MKNTIRTPGIVFLTAIYFFAISVVTPSFSYTNLQETTNPGKGSWYQSVAANLSSYATKAEVFVNEINTIPAPNFKNQFNSPWAIIKVHGQLIQTRLFQYRHYSSKFLAKHQKSDIIFPFHNFW